MIKKVVTGIVGATLCVGFIACSDDTTTNTGDMSVPPGGDLAMVKTVKVTGPVLGPDAVVSGILGGKMPAQAIADSALAGAVVTVDGMPTIMSAATGADGTYTINVPQNSKFHMIVKETATTVQVYDDEETVTTTVDLVGIPTHYILKANPSSLASAVAASSPTVTQDAMLAAGACIVDVLAVYAPPDIRGADGSIAVDAGFDVYEQHWTPGTGAQAATKSNASGFGRYLIWKPGNTAATTVKITATGLNADAAHTWDMYTCNIKPGMVTWAAMKPKT